MRVWLDQASWNASTGGVEQYNFNPFRTLGAIYKFAKYTLSIIEGNDAIWLEEMVQEWIRAGRSDAERGQSFGEAFFSKEELVQWFAREVRDQPYSYWNRAWILQELMQSNAVLYCVWSDHHFRPLVQGFVLGSMISAISRYRTTPRFSAQFMGWQANNSLLAAREAMAAYLQYAVPATVRARNNINYHYQRDISRAITYKTYHAQSRSDALYAIAVLLGLDVLPSETALARAVHHAMVRNGALPGRTSCLVPVPQSFAHSSWAARYCRNSTDTAELRDYLPVPIPGEVLPDGRLALSGNALRGTIMGTRLSQDDEAVRDIILTDGHCLGTLPSVIFYLNEDDRALCWIFRTENITFFVSVEHLVLLGSLPNLLIRFETRELAEPDWITRVLYVH